jgi:hypothetical protein
MHIFQVSVSSVQLVSVNNAKRFVLKYNMLEIGSQVCSISTHK